MTLAEVLGQTWVEVKDSDPRAVGIFRRHYSCIKYRHGRLIDHLAHGITPPGESMVLLTPSCDALFVWSKQQYRADGQTGVNCSVFRSEGIAKASDLITAACEMAWQRWPGKRLFTFVNVAKVKPIKCHDKILPGFCFIKAGWQHCGESKKGLIILELLP